MGSLYRYTIKLLLISPLEYWGIAAIATTSPRPRLPKAFLKRRLKLQMTSICLVSAGVRRLNPLRTLRGSLLESVQHFIQLYQTEQRTMYIETAKLNHTRRKILTIHQRRQQLSLLLFANGATQRPQLMTSGTDHIGSGIGSKLICKTNENGKKLGANLEQYQ